MCSGVRIKKREYCYRCERGSRVQSRPYSLQRYQTESSTSSAIARICCDGAGCWQIGAPGRIHRGEAHCGLVQVRWEGFCPCGMEGSHARALKQGERLQQSCALVRVSAHLFMRFRQQEPVSEAPLLPLALRVGCVGHRLGCDLPSPAWEETGTEPAPVASHTLMKRKKEKQLESVSVYSEGAVVQLCLVVELLSVSCLRRSFLVYAPSWATELMRSCTGCCEQTVWHTCICEMCRVVVAVLSDKHKHTIVGVRTVPSTSRRKKRRNICSRP